MSEVPKTSRAACVATYKEPLEIREVPIPDEIEPGAILVKTASAFVLKICCPTAIRWIK